MNIALTIAGSDSGGGAGIQADLKTFHQFGVFGTSALVAITAQNTLGVTAVHSIPVDVVLAQLRAVAEDLAPRAVKTGMLATSELVATVADAIRDFAFPNLVVDPVMVASSGDRLLEDDAVDTVAKHLIPLARLVTPNLHEAELLAGMKIGGPDDMERAGRRLLDSGVEAVLVKGGHLDADEVVDVLVTSSGAKRYPHPWLDTISTHGTGCTLSAAITALLASGARFDEAVPRALDFVFRAIREAPSLGGGHGPLNHFVEATP